MGDCWRIVVDLGLFLFVSCLRFKLKYHPEMSIARKEEQIGYLKVSS
jgi:hypothetical protein